MFTSLLAIFAWASFYGYGIKPAWPDGELYISLASLIFDQGVYEDRFRNDEILPSIGHPLLLGILSRVFGNFASAYAVTFVALAGLLSWTLGPVCPLWCLPLAIVAWFFSDATFSYFAVGGVESSLILFGGAVCAGVIAYVMRPNWKTLLLFSVVVALSILFRPMLLPASPVLLLAAVSYGYWHRMRRELTAVLAGVVILAGTWVVSEATSGDNRMLTGTYGAQGLYPAFNPYLDLTRNYNSGLWKKLGVEEGLLHYENVAGWQERSQRLYRLSWEFIVNHPERAWEGFMFRLGRYTWGSEATNAKVTSIRSYELLQVISLCLGIGIALAGRWRSREFLALMMLWGYFVYSALINAVFVYAGGRYMLTNWVILVFVVVWTMHTIATSGSQLVRRNTKN